MPTYPHIEQYRAHLKELKEFGGSDNELSIRPAFQNCLDAYCREHREKLALIPELSAGGVIPDGTVKDSLRMARGYWEAKDTHDDLDAEIQKKFNSGYPRDNILFEDSETAVLFQNGNEAMRVDMGRPGELHRLIRRFLDHELPEIGEFRQARQQFKADLPAVLVNLREVVEAAEHDNSAYQSAVESFLELCRISISPYVFTADVREMLLQHILTKDVFLRIFGEDQFHRENNVARQLDALEQTFFTGPVRRQAIDRLRAYYGAIGRAADEIADYAEKQQFLKAIYEDFYKAYNPEAADYLGVVYTPGEVVDFIIRGTDYLLQKYFGKTVADDNVQILDPATGTGTFITSLINYLPQDRLEYKYRNEIHANEVAILPYYIANLNIEYSYKEKTGSYLEFPNLCFVDTLDNMGWQGSTEGAVIRQGAFNLGALSEENWLRLQEQNEKTISVIIGNPPYNDSAILWGDGRDNRPYAEIDRRIKETYVEESTAQKTHQYDMYKRFIRWASDRLSDDGIIGFITNRAYLDALQDDGFRKIMAREFSDLYIVDLGGNFQSDGNVGNVFDIRIGVAIAFFVRDSRLKDTGTIRYHRIFDEQSKEEKLSLLKNLGIENFTFENIVPDTRNGWLNQSNSGFENLIPLTANRSNSARNTTQGNAFFTLVSPGVKTDRDEWVYDFDVGNLRNKALFFADAYNRFLDDGDNSFNPIIKWSRDLRNEFQRGRRIVYHDGNRVQSLYRPFVVKEHFADFTMNDVLTRNHYQIFGPDLKQTNKVICVKGPAANCFSVLAAGKLANEKFAGTNDGGTFCLPLYRYTAEGVRVSNITDWGLRQFREHYADDSISAEDVFAYTYGVLHDPVYREKYAVDLLREFPRLPFYPEFRHWVKMGQELLDLHIGFESVEPFPLERVEQAGEAKRVNLRVDKERGVIILDDVTSLTGVPPEAWRYRLGSRSALEWVLDQYKERKPRDPTIAEKFNTYKFADYKERVIDLLQKVCAVSVGTMEVVDDMAYWDDAGKLVVYGHRDEGEWSMAALASLARHDEEEDPEWLAGWSET